MKYHVDVSRMVPPSETCQHRFAKLEVNTYLGTGKAVCNDCKELLPIKVSVECNADGAKATLTPFEPADYNP